MNFSVLTFDVKDKLAKMLDLSFVYRNYFGSELNFSNLYAWKNVDKIRYHCENGHCILIRGRDNGTPCFFPPVARDKVDFMQGIRHIDDYCREHNIPFLIRGLTKTMIDIIAESGDEYDSFPERDLDEYLYRSVDLRTLSGTNYHRKRNLVNQILRLPHELKPYSPKDRPIIENLLHQWENDKNQQVEHEAIFAILDRLIETGAFADILYVEERPIAFAIGTKNAKMGIVLFEKADRANPGNYAAINYLFANRHFADVELINRQEDLGIASLRTAKMGYHPIDFVRKFALCKRRLTSEEIEGLKTLYTESFADSSGYIDYFFKEKYDSSRVVFHQEAGQIISALYFIDKRISLFEKPLLVPFVVAVATKPAFRRKGYMKLVMKQALYKLRNEHVTLTVLSPFDPAYYDRFGFVTVVSAETRIYPKQPSDFHVHPSQPDLHDVIQLYDQKTQSYGAFVLRDDEDWASWANEIASDNGTIHVVFDSSNQPVGYFVRFENTATDICFPDETQIQASNALNGLETYQTGKNLPQAHSMFRIVNVRNFLLEYPYTMDTNLTWNIEIIDAFLESNNLTLELIVEDGVAKIREIDRADASITIEELTKRAFVDGQWPFRPISVLVHDQY